MEDVVYFLRVVFVVWGIWIFYFISRYLFVYYDIDDGVVDGGVFGKEGREGYEDGVKVGVLVSEDVECYIGIGYLVD